MAAWVCNTTHYYENVLWQEELDGGGMIGITLSSSSENEPLLCSINVSKSDTAAFLCASIPPPAFLFTPATTSQRPLCYDHSKTTFFNLKVLTYISPAKANDKSTVIWTKDSLVFF